VSALPLLDVVIDPITRDFVDAPDGGWLESTDARTQVQQVPADSYRNTLGATIDGGGFTIVAANPPTIGDVGTWVLDAVVDVRKGARPGAEHLFCDPSDNPHIVHAKLLALRSVPIWTTLQRVKHRSLIVLGWLCCIACGSRDKPVSDLSPQSAARTAAPAAPPKKCYADPDDKTHQVNCGGIGTCLAECTATFTECRAKCIARTCPEVPCP
jgi:hypothetical protein